MWSPLRSWSMNGTVECTGVWSPFGSVRLVCGVYRSVEPIGEWECVWVCGAYRSMEPIENWECGVCMGLWSVQECGAH